MTARPKRKQHTALVAAYWHQYIAQYAHQDRAESDRWFWAWEEVQEVVERTPGEALPLVVALADYCLSAQGLAYLGAGPVEDLVKRADDELFERMLKAATKNARFRRALATIWIDDNARIRELKQFFRQHPPTLPDGVVDDARGP
jgi:hypothetical protein